MRLRSVLSAVAAANALGSTLCLANNGIQPPATEYRFDAVCGVMRSPNLNPPGTAGSGVLIAPNLVLSTSHILSPTEQPSDDPVIVDVLPNDNNPIATRKNLVVRFRRRLDDTVAVGPEPDGMGGYTGGDSHNAYYHVGVQEVLRHCPTGGLGEGGGAILLKLEHDVPHITPMKLLYGAPSPVWRWSDSYSAGFGIITSGGPAGHLRVLTGETPQRFVDSGASGRFVAGARRDTDLTQIVIGTEGTLTDRNSGGATLFVDANGDVALFAPISDGVWLGHYYRNDLLGCPDPIDPAYTSEITRGEFLNEAELASVDLTSSMAPTAAGYGAPDFAVDMYDAIYASVRVAAGDISLDRTTTNSLPGDGTYGLPDGQVDQDDLDYILNIINAPGAGRPSPFFPRTVPLALDLQRDGRLNSLDLLVAQRMVDDGGYGTTAEGLTLDLDGNGVFEQADVDALAPLVDSLGHGLFGDLNNSGTVTTGDGIVLQSILANDPTLFSRDVRYGDPDYLFALDFDSDGRLSDVSWADTGGTAGADRGQHNDRAACRAQLLGDVSDGVFPLFVSASQEGDGIQDDNDLAMLGAYWLRLRTVTTQAFYPVFLDLWSPSMGNPLTAGNPDGIVDYGDLLRIFKRSLTISGVRAGTLDFNNDGRFNELDWQYYDANLYPATRVFRDDDLAVTDSSFFLGQFLPAQFDNPDAIWFDHGFLGDFNQDAGYLCPLPLFVGEPVDLSMCTGPTAAADCQDLIDLQAAMTAGTFAFDGRTADDPSYLFEMDADLDGDNDASDMFEVYALLQPADITTNGTTNYVPDGCVSLSDFSAYLNLWQAGDTRADITLEGVCDPFAGGGDGVTLTDFSCYLAHFDLKCVDCGP